MNTWWLAIDKQWCSYDELSQRGVLAQGWPGLGDLSTLLKFVPDHPNGFKSAVVNLGDTAYGKLELWTTNDRNPHRAPSVIWDLLNLRRGDLVVGLEGKTVRGICQLPWDARYGYGFDRHWPYAQAVGPVEWVDWDAERFGFTPKAPAQGVHGVKHLAGERDQVVEAWRTKGNVVRLHRERWVNVDLPTRSCVVHKSGCSHVPSSKATEFKGEELLNRDGGWFGLGDGVRAAGFATEFGRVRRLAVQDCELCAALGDYVTADESERSGEIHRIDKA